MKEEATDVIANVLLHAALTTRCEKYQKALERIRDNGYTMTQHALVKVAREALEAKDG